KGVSARARRGENYWTAFSSLVARDRHRYGGYFIHLGMVVLGIGVIGSTAFQKTTSQTLGVGDRLALGEYELQHNGLYEAQAEDGRVMYIARTTVYKDGKIVDHLRPRRDLFLKENPMTGQMEVQTNMSIPGSHSTLEGDFYARIEYTEGSLVTFRAYLNPLINFVWLGGFILIAGTMVALWPSRAAALATKRKQVEIPTSAGPVSAGD
ncbi:MAG: hypothetical protein HY866_23775, partial [Chloroflexi bacterium]|nr:hypothetical protein [Chloroflexota bacterium]